MPSTVILQFNSIAVVNETIGLGTHPSLGPIFPIFIDSQSRGFNEVVIGFSNTNQRLNFQSAVRTDFNTFDDFEFQAEESDPGVSGLDRLRITYLNSPDFFQNAQDSSQGNITVVDIISTPQPIDLEVTDFDYTEASTNKCSTVDIDITTSKQVDLVRYSGNDINVNTNPFTININRSLTPRITFFSNGEEYSEVFYPPVQFFIDRVDQSFTPNGYAARIVVTASGITQQNIFNVLEYSLNDVDYQMSNNFPNMIAGDYTAYVRDPYGCKKQISFSIIEDESSANRIPDYFLYPKSNSIHMVLRDDKVKNVNNTLSCEEEGFNQMVFTQKIKKEWDSLPNQFRSTYDTHVLNLVDEDENLTLIPVNKVSNNINIFDSRDAYFKKYDDNCVGVYLNGGNLYDAQTLDILEGQSNLFGRLPSFYKVDSYIKLGNEIGWYQITEILYDEDLTSFVAKTNYRANTVSEDSFIATSNYNQLDYEVYEFDIDWTNYEGCYYLTLECTRDNKTINLQSEILEVSESFRNVYELISTNSENSNVNYNTQSQIKHRLLLPYIDIKRYSSSTEVDSSRSDTKITHLSGSVTDRVIFNVDLVPAFMVQKIIRLISLDGLFINGIGYTNPEFEDEPVGNTNLYSLSITLTPNNNQFESNSDLRVISNIENSGFIVTQQSGGFLKHDN